MSNNINSPPRKERMFYSPTGSLTKGKTTFFGAGSLGNRPDLKQGLSTSRVNLTTTPGSSYRIQHHHSLSNQSAQLDVTNTGNSPGGNGGRPFLNPRHTFNGTYTGLGNLSASDDNLSIGHRARKSDSSGTSNRPRPRSSGLVFSSTIDRELASIDKINDPLANSLVCAGKSHVGIYRFNKEDRTIRLIHDVTKTESPHLRLQSSSMFAPRRNRQSKFSTISDVKSGFQNLNNYVAVCANSTSISVFDINNNTSPLITSLNEHKRSVNSFDFNMVQTNLLISGGQDGCAKIWDLRANSAANLKNNGRCEININTAYDSIRDIKWMPSYSFDSPVGNESTPSSINSGNINGTTPRSNSGYKFASIHDSGVLLKFDLRQPQQFEKKINAHTGPGLCLNWHPNLDYVVTGGRDGKCCLWYVGDKESHSTNYISSNISVFPETTINFGSPITKLKFCPAYNEEPHNSLLAISSMGEEAQVGIYSLARKYVPKNLLETSAASLGLVWWDSDNIFTIDKRNRINGWDLTMEPTVLENLPKTVTTWRDIEGNGLLFVNQDEGTYDITDPYFSRSNIHDYSTNNNSNLLMSSTSINQYDTSNKRIHSPPTPTPNERPSMFKMGSTFNGKNFASSPMSPTPLSSTPSIHSEMAPYGTHDIYNTNIESPLVVTLDLPKIIGSMRIAQITKFENLRNNKRIDKESLDKLQESPIEVFKYLARELEFSVKRENSSPDDFSRRNSAELDFINNGSLQDDNDDTGKNLMKKFGLAENGTWTNLINKKSDQQEKKHSEPMLRNGSTSGTRSSRQDSLNDRSSKYSSVHEERLSSTESNSIKRTDNSNSTGQNSSLNVDQPVKEIDDKVLKLQEKMRLFVDFLTAASHNASVYANINDILNFKVWILIRDTIMWDLKKMDSLLPKTNEEPDHVGNHDSESVNSSVIEDNTIPVSHLRKQSINSDFSRFNESIRTSSLVEEHPQPFRSMSEDSGIDPIDRETITNLRKQLRNNGEPSHNFATTDTIDNLESKDSIDEQRQLSNESAIAQDDDDDEEEESKQEQENNNKETSKDVSPDLTGKSPEGIPILNGRSKRLSFIDTFMSDAHSPLNHSGEERSRRGSMTIRKSVGGPYSGSFDHHSVRSKISSLDSISSNYQTHVPFLKRLSDTKKLVPTIREAFSYENVLKSVEDLDLLNGKGSNGNNFPKRNQPGLCPPWNTETILQQVYEQAAEGGNILLAVNILLLFHDVYQLASLHVVKSSVSEFITLLHRYELFEIATELLKYCGWNDIMGPENEQSDIRLFCDRCGELIVNEPSKEKYTRSLQTHHYYHKHDKNDIQFGFWYCDNCKKPNTLCVLCERPIKKLTVGLLECGHEGHFDCFRTWFLKEGMTTCPAGCPARLNI